MKYLNALLTFFMFLPLGLADHNEPIGTSGYLLDQTAGLNSEVQNSTLNYNVKSSVSQFYSDVTAFKQCDDPTDDHGHPNCQNALSKMSYSWQPVERYLSDTMYDYPNVYNHYVETRRGLYAIPGYNNPPPQNYLRSSGVMNQFSYFFQELTQEAIYNKCYNFGMQNHIYYVNYLTVNGYTIYNGQYSTYLSEACQMISRYAKWN